MSYFNSPPLVPRNGHTLVVVIIARISGCPNQKELSLEDQIDHAKQIVAELYDKPVEYRVIATTGKGEALDRPELKELVDTLRTREIDMLVAEDLGRVVRGTAAKEICGIAVDHGTRVIAPNDCIDTADESWEEDVIAACRDHVGHNSHTSKRIKHKKMNRFLKFGGATPCEIFGYLKPPGTKTYDGWQKDPAAIKVYREWLRILRETLNCQAVADWLNSQDIPVGPHCRREGWDGPMVRRITANPLLKGMPGRGFKHTIKHHGTGKRIAVKNPKGPVYREYPDLAHWDPVEFDELNARLAEANKRSARTTVNGTDPRLRVPRTRTRFPGQHAVCWYCGRQAVWGGNGHNDRLMCTGARQGCCWYSISFDGARVTDAVATALTEEFARLDDFEAQFRELVGAANQQGDADRARAWEQLARDEEEGAKRQQNLMDAIARYGARSCFDQKLAQLESNARDHARRRTALLAVQKRAPQLPGSVAELRQLFIDKCATLQRDSDEFANLLRQLAPEIHVYLVRLCDGGHLLPRARIRLHLAGIVADARDRPELEQVLTRTLTVDLFDPPQRERIRTEAVRLIAEGLTQREVARRQGVKQPAVTNALALDRLMRGRNLDTPYELVVEPPTDYPKLRRQLHKRYRFLPRQGYVPPPL
jgi:site-specific DNA recombinase